MESCCRGASDNENSSHWPKANCCSQKIYCQGDLSLVYKFFLLEIEWCLSFSELNKQLLLCWLYLIWSTFLASHVFHSKLNWSRNTDNWEAQNDFALRVAGHGGGANATSSGEEAENDCRSSHWRGSSFRQNWGAQNAFHLSHYVAFQKESLHLGLFCVVVGLKSPQFCKSWGLLSFYLYFWSKHSSKFIWNYANILKIMFIFFDRYLTVHYYLVFYVNDTKIYVFTLLVHNVAVVVHLRYVFCFDFD